MLRPGDAFVGTEQGQLIQVAFSAARRARHLRETACPGRGVAIEVADFAHRGSLNDLGRRIISKRTITSLHIMFYTRSNNYI